MNKHIIDDASRCLQCRRPLCKQGCPVNTPINEVIELFMAGEIEKAGEQLFENNPLSSVCALICPQEDQCEAACILGRKGMPVQFSAIEDYISEYYLNVYNPIQPEQNRGKVALIGGGPAGITIAFILAKRGFDVTIFEGNEDIGGVLRYGIPEFRLPKRILDKLKEKLVMLGVKIRPNTIIGISLNVDELFRDGFKAVFIGTGVWRPLKLGVKGEGLGHVHFGIEYLKSPDTYHLGRTVLVIGGGDAAMDVARTALRHGATDVTVVYNKGETYMRASETEVRFAKLDGVKFLFSKETLEITDRGALLADTETMEENGRSTARPLPETAALHSADSIIIAVGQGPRAIIISSTEGIGVNEKGLVQADKAGVTTREGVFASGDVVSGSKTVVEAVRVSKQVADAMTRYIDSLDKDICVLN